MTGPQPGDLVLLGFDGSRDDDATPPVSFVNGMGEVIAFTPPRPDPLKVLRDAIADAAATFRRGIEAYGRFVGRVGRHAIACANEPVRIAGLEARYAVRAGLDPAYRHPEQLQQLLDDISAGNEPDMALISRANLNAIARAAADGWARSYLPAGVRHQLAQEQ